MDNFEAHACSLVLEDFTFTSMSVSTYFVGEILVCSRVTPNLHDRFAVNVLKADTNVGLNCRGECICSTCTVFLVVSSQSSLL